MRCYLVILVGAMLLCQQADSRCLAITADSNEGVSEIQRAFEQLDANDDGQLKSDEIAAEKRLLFERLLRTSDADGSGSLSLAEYTGGLRVRREAKPLVEKPPERLPGSDELLLLLAMCDKNADGIITPEEPSEQLQPFHEQLRNRIGGENRDRIKVRQVAQIAPQMTRFAEQVVKRQDIDVSLEYALLPEKHLAMIHRLKSPQRPGEAATDPKRTEEFFQQFDANGDGQIALDELPERVANRFDQLLARADLNSDEQISKQELEQVSARIREALKAQDRKKKQRQKAREKRLKQADSRKKKSQKTEKSPQKMDQEVPAAGE